MSATLLLSRTTSFEALQAAMPSGSVTLTCRAAAGHAAAVLRAPSLAPLPAAPPPAGPAQQPYAPPAVPPAASSSDMAAGGAAAVSRQAPLPAPPAPLAPVLTSQPSADSEAQALADQLEDLLVFTRSPHHGPEDPQLLVHSPPAAALRASGGHAGSDSSASGAASEEAPAEEVTPRASTAAAAAAALPALSPASQLAVGEAGSLAELLRGPRPLREIVAQELTRSPACMARAFSQELPPALGLLEEDVAAVAARAAAAQRSATPAPAAAPTPAPVPPASLALRASAAAVASLPGSCPLSPTADPLSPSKSSGAMIQLANLHKVGAGARGSGLGLLEVLNGLAGRRQ